MCLLCGPWRKGAKSWLASSLLLLGEENLCRTPLYIDSTQGIVDPKIIERAKDGKQRLSKYVLGGKTQHNGDSF